MSGTRTSYSRKPVKAVVIPEDKNEIKVTSLSNYKNGMLEQNWRRGETRVITPELLKRLIQDLPENWKVE
ncbi:MAG: hypothetical protein WC455_21800 [Dehalococcoidia bacterium]|jgi:uncharacterized protein with NAD-binding domain and iron-sulfur cluster